MILEDIGKIVKRNFIIGLIMIIFQWVTLIFFKDYLILGMIAGAYGVGLMSVILHLSALKKKYKGDSDE